MLRFINSSTTGIRTRFGKFDRMLEPGLNVYIPGMHQIYIVSNRLTQKLLKFDIKTKDNIFANLQLSVQYQIKQENSSLAFFSLDCPTSQMQAYIENVVRSKTSQMELDEIFESQNDICEEILNKLSGKMYQHGYSIIDTLVTLIEPPNEVKNAMNHINAAERLKEATKNEADELYLKELRQAEEDKEKAFVKWQMASM